MFKDKRVILNFSVFFFKSEDKNDIYMLVVLWGWYEIMYGNVYYSGSIVS